MSKTVFPRITVHNFNVTEDNSQYIENCENLHFPFLGSPYEGKLVWEEVGKLTSW